MRKNLFIVSMLFAFQAYSGGVGGLWIGQGAATGEESDMRYECTELWSDHELSDRAFTINGGGFDCGPLFFTKDSKISFERNEKGELFNGDKLIGNATEDSVEYTIHHPEAGARFEFHAKLKDGKLDFSEAWVLDDGSVYLKVAGILERQSRSEP